MQVVNALKQMLAWGDASPINDRREKKIALISSLCLIGTSAAEKILQGITTAAVTTYNANENLFWQNCPYTDNSHTHKICPADKPQPPSAAGDTVSYILTGLSTVCLGIIFIIEIRSNVRAQTTAQVLSTNSGAHAPITPAPITATLSSGTEYNSLPDASSREEDPLLFHIQRRVPPTADYSIQGAGVFSSSDEDIPS